MTDFKFNYDPTPTGSYIGSGPVSIIYAGYGMPPGYLENFNFSGAIFGNITQLNFNYMSGMSMPGRATFKSSQFGASLISNSLLIYGATGETDIVVNLDTASFDASGWKFAPNDYSQGINWIQITSSGGIVGDRYNDYATDFVYINGNSSDNSILGSIQSDLINGGNGADMIIGGLGNDDLNGDDGIDTTSYVTAGSAIVVDLSITGWQDTLGAGSDKLANFENLTGSSYDDLLTGNTGNNLLSGGAGNDKIKGAGGNDILDGGTGVNWAVYSGNRADYLISFSYGAFTVTDTRAGSPDGSDLAINIQGFQFADQTFSPSILKSTMPIDFDGNGTSDILLQDFGTGAIVDWLVQNESVISGNLLGSAPDWAIVGTGDFNGDRTSDILLQNADGNVVAWFMQNGSVVGGALVGNSVGFNIAGTGDFNGDGTTDILLKDAGGNVVEWMMQNGSVASGSVVGNTVGYNIVGAGDFNGDATTDILLQNADGNVVSWLMQNGAVVAGSLMGNSVGYNVVGTGDFNGDLTTDILFQDASGNVVDWMVQNGAVNAGNLLGTAPGWLAAATGDYNGNGVTDILLTNNSGAVVDWTMQNGVVTGGAVIGNSVGFTVQA